MSRYEQKAQIRASVHCAWTVLADFERWPEWNSSVIRIEPLGRKPLGLGSRFLIHQPKLRPAYWVITEWEPEHRFVWESASPAVAAVGSHVLETRGEGCELTLDLYFKGLLGGVAGFFGGRLVKRYMRLEAEGLKARSEGSV
jgi:hypothetical protein